MRRGACLPALSTPPGGGVARGFAHIGVIKGLEARGIEPDIDAGNHAGAGERYAPGMNGIAIKKLALKMDEAAISD
jgi:NTE family protein